MSKSRWAGHFFAGALAAALAPGLSLKDLAGKPVRLEDLRGKVVLVDFWATWCDSCLDSLPVYEKLYETRKADGLVVLGVDEDARAKGVAAFAAKRGVTYPVVLDADKDAYYAWRVRGLPSAFLIDADGHVARWPKW
jgi:peroxiredoxin